MNINQLISTVAAVNDQPPRRWHVIITILLIALYLAAWIAFLAAVTYSRVHRPQFLYDHVPNTIPWFDVSDAPMITLPFLIPASALFLATWLEWLTIRYQRQAIAVIAMLLEANDKLAPIIPSNISDVTAEMMAGEIKHVTRVGWSNAGRRFRINHMWFLVSILVAQSAQAIVSLTHSYATGNQPIDVLTPLVILIFMVVIFILWIRNLLRDSSIATIDELGVVMPALEPSQTESRIPWQEIHAIYSVQAKAGNLYWLLVTDGCVYAWVLAPLDMQNNGIKLAQAIMLHTHLPMRDATQICEIVLSSDGQRWSAPNTSTYSPKWQRALDLANARNRHYRLSFAPAISMVVIGLALGIAATYVIAQIATLTMPQ